MRWCSLIFPWIVWVSETTMWHSRQASVNTFPHLSLIREVMIVLRWSLELFVPDGHLFSIFVPLPTAVLIGFPKEANISLEAAVGQILFLRAVCIGFHSQYQSTLIPVPPSLRLMWLQENYTHTLFLGSKCSILPRPLQPMWNQGPHWKGWC